MYVHGFTVHNFNQLSQQVFVAITEMQMSLSPLMQGTMRMGAVPVRRMVIFLMPGQMLQKQRRPSASLSVAQQVYQTNMYIRAIYRYIYI
jgi:hypothetical protein